ncbi:MAG: hypothetical protein Q8S73_26590 [Deltaproteobacteria bacterium]|nr:hypothetical protein [Myxococcales bacterium]MDP3217704.1 hypothetical protein [Deltaproteobacteria bacterium]
MARSFDRFTLPADLALTPCAHCGAYVESVDSRGRCDDCAGDRLLALVGEVSIVDTATALHLGALTFARRASDAGDFAHDPVDACGCDLCDAARAELNDWLDGCRAGYLDAVDGGPLPFELAWTPAANDTDARVGEVA